MNENKECCERIWGDYSYSKCSRPAKFEVDGKPYCGTHNPNRGPTKAQIQAEIDRKERQRIYMLNRAAPELLDIARRLVDDGLSTGLVKYAKEVIAKATEETA